MKNLILVSLIILFTKCSFARYIPDNLDQMILGSTLIVDAVIINQSEYHVILNITKTLKGDTSLKRIKLDKFMNWTCASRWSEYKIGQRSIYMLSMNETKTAWEVLSPGNEGEFPIEMGNIYYRTINYNFNHPPQENKIEAGNIYAFKFDYNIFLKGIKEYLKNHSKIKQSISRNNIFNYKTKNELILHIINELSTK